MFSDVNECADSSLWKCPTNSQCVNTQGRYTCTCNTGCHYVWPYGARDIGYCLCDGTSGPNVDGSLNSDASFCEYLIYKCLTAMHLTAVIPFRLYQKSLFRIHSESASCYNLSSLQIISLLDH